MIHYSIAPSLYFVIATSYTRAPCSRNSSSQARWSPSVMYDIANLLLLARRIIFDTFDPTCWTTIGHATQSSKAADPPSQKQSTRRPLSVQLFFYAAIYWLLCDPETLFCQQFLHIAHQRQIQLGRFLCRPQASLQQRQRRHRHPALELLASIRERSAQFSCGLPLRRCRQGRVGSPLGGQDALCKPFVYAARPSKVASQMLNVSVFFINSALLL